MRKPIFVIDNSVSKMKIFGPEEDGDFCIQLMDYPINGRFDVATGYITMQEMKKFIHKVSNKIIEYECGNKEKVA